MCEVGDGVEDVGIQESLNIVEGSKMRSASASGSERRAGGQILDSEASLKLKEEIIHLEVSRDTNDTNADQETVSSFSNLFKEFFESSANGITNSISNIDEMFV